MALVAEGPGGRVYLPPTKEHEDCAIHAKPSWGPEAELSTHPQYMAPPRYGMTTFRDLFTPRQLTALTTLSGLISEVRDMVCHDAQGFDLPNDQGSLAEGGLGAIAYGDAVATYLAFGVDKSTLTNCTLATWQTSPDRLSQAFSRQAVLTTWDYAEANPMSEAGGGFILTLQSLAEVLQKLPSNDSGALVRQQDTVSTALERGVCISTDPPYYDNVPYADLSDFFYVWLRASLKEVFPNLFGTVLVPKGQELVADQFRHSSRDNARQFFEDGLARSFSHIQLAQDPRFPLTVYYAFKQAEGSDTNDKTADVGAIASTGWETMLEGLVSAGFSVTGTWPMRTELTTSLKKEMSVLASSIILVCRPRAGDAPVTTRREFRAALKRELPEALRNLQHGNIAPVDLAQASIGPGMAVFSRFSKVLEVDGSPMRVRTALQIINEALDEVVTEQDSEYDTDTRWALAWYEQFGLKTAGFGDAETLSRAKNTSVQGLQEAGILEARSGKVRLLSRKELPANWDPAIDRRFTVWEATQHLARALEEGANTGAAALLVKLGARGEAARDLAYRLYLLCERKGWADEALAYNALVVAWPDITSLARTIGNAPIQTTLEGLLR
jgi:putative DNA methylase